ncbi:MAG: Ribose import permease protein RbsC [Phycisphaerae bacterium]|nr:Ribose import permease protein RbsC [Phycisphaerae bacterium]
MTQPAAQVELLPPRSTVATIAQRLMSSGGPFAGLILLVVLFYVLDPTNPPGLDDLRTVLVHTVIVGTSAIGMTYIIISGGIDLSVGSVIALSSVSAALVLRAGGNVFLAAAAALGTGALCGLYNGLLVTVLRLPPFIATLGTLGFYRGVAKWISDSIPVTAPSHGLENWVAAMPHQEWMLVAPAVWLMLAIALFFDAVLRFTIFGKYTFAIGSNEATARLCGIRVSLTKVWIYVLGGTLTGLAGLLQFARLTQGDPTVAAGKELDIIAAVVIGGGSLAGGQGTLAGTLGGAFMMAYLSNRCVAMGWSNYVQEMIVGHIIIVAVAIDQWRMRRSG